MSVVNYVLFPDDAFVPASIAVGSAMLLDIITKYYAVCVNNGGFREALRTRKLSSASLWKGTQRKLISYLVIMVLCGLSVRVTMLTSVAVFIATVAYSIMFLRESQSVIENLIDAGHEDLEWFLFFLKRKQSKVLEEDGGIADPIENMGNAMKDLDGSPAPSEEDNNGPSGAGSNSEPKNHPENVSLFDERV
nr:phage holin family protein [Brevibacillus sp. SYP-B805]